MENSYKRKIPCWSMIFIHEYIVNFSVNGLLFEWMKINIFLLTLATGWILSRNFAASGQVFPIYSTEKLTSIYQ
jgi:hypothetical protein